MSKQLNIPVNTHPTIDPYILASNLNRELNEVSQDLSRLTGKKIIFNRDGSELKPYRGWETQTPGIDVKHFTPDSKPCTVAGVDSSCIPIADTAEGSIYAARAAVVFSSRGALSSYFRIGPIITYIDENTASNICQTIPRFGRLSHVMLQDRVIAQRIIRVRLERAVALELAKTLSNSVILLDGCLKSSRFEGLEASLSRILKAADESYNRVIGLSKTTRIGLISRLSNMLYSSSSLPAYIDVDRLAAPLLSGVEGHTLLVRFSEDGHPFRVDIYPGGEVEAPLSLAVSNDLFYRGYPETLRLAHHLSVFTTAQRECVESYLVRNLGLIDVPSEDLRYAALGSLSFKHRM